MFYLYCQYYLKFDILEYIIVKQKCMFYLYWQYYLKFDILEYIIVKEKCSCLEIFYRQGHTIFL